MEKDSLFILIAGLILILSIPVSIFIYVFFNNKNDEDSNKNLEKKSSKDKDTVKKENDKLNKNSKKEKRKEDNKEKENKEESNLASEEKKEKSNYKKQENLEQDFILIVDDSNVTRKMLLNDLKDKEYETISAENGKDALRKVKRKKPKLIITDIEMPEMDGNELLRQIKSNLETSDIPVIMITANLSTDILVGGKNGADGFLHKPYDKEDLLDQIEYLLNS